jgi:polar amino acid transport system substrate-binding protein
MKRRFSLIHLLVVVALVFGLAGFANAGKIQNALVKESVLTDILKRGVIRVGFATFIPWAMPDKNGKYIGFEIDVMTRLAEDMGVEIEFAQTKWSGIIPALLTGKFDVIIGGMAMTPKRNLKVNFTVPYNYSGLVLAANREACAHFNPTKLEDFNREDVIFAERIGSTPVQFIKRMLPKAQIRLFDDQAQAYQELRNGKATAIMGDAPRPTFEAAKYPETIYQPLGSEKLTHEPISFALRKGDPDWLNYLNNWITFQHSKPWMKDRDHYWYGTRDWEDQVQ